MSEAFKVGDAVEVTEERRARFNFEFRELSAPHNYIGIIISVHARHSCGVLIGDRVWRLETRVLKKL
jgi:hypothetical protein